MTAIDEAALRKHIGSKITEEDVATAAPIAMLIATFDRDAMLGRISTRHESPFSTDPDWLNKRLAMLLSALGRAYLAYCPDEERELIFEKFYRAKDRRISSVTGTGLGLAISSRIVEAHRGKLHVSSKVGEGSTFIVEIPNDLGSEEKRAS